MNIIQKETPNYSEGRDGKYIKYIVIHWIGAGTAESTIPWFANPDSKVSAHYLVSDDTIYQFVDNQDTAWHAGNWQMNCESIGIEHVATPDRLMSDSSYETSGALVRQLSGQYGIPLDRDHIIGHSEVKATQCPGTIDIDRIIEIARGNSSNCEKELEEMRDSRNSWRQKQRETQETLEREREEHAKAIASKDKLIADYEQQVKGLQTELLDARREKAEALARERIAIEQRDNKQLEVDNLREELEKCQAKVFSQSQTITKLRKKVKAKLCEFGWVERWLSLLTCRGGVKDA